MFHKSAESSNISYTAFSIYSKATYNVLASFKTPVHVLSVKTTQNLSQKHGYYDATVTRLVEWLLYRCFFIHIKCVLFIYGPSSFE